MSDNRLIRLLLPLLGLALLIAVWHAYVAAFDVPVAVLPRPGLVLDSTIANWRLIVSEGWITLLEGDAIAGADEEPTLWCSTSSRPHVSSARLVTAAQSSSRATSAATVTHWPPSAPMSPAVTSAAVGLTSTMTTRAPSRAKRTATERPMPESPPVTRATLSFSFSDPL